MAVSGRSSFFSADASGADASGADVIDGSGGAGAMARGASPGCCARFASSPSRPSAFFASRSARSASSRSALSIASNSARTASSASATLLAASAAAPRATTSGAAIALATFPLGSSASLFVLSNSSSRSTYSSFSANSTKSGANADQHSSCDLDHAYITPLDPSATHTGRVGCASSCAMPFASAAPEPTRSTTPSDRRHT